MVAHEPVRDRVSPKNAALSVLIQSLLSLNGGFWNSVPMSADVDDLNAKIGKVFNALRYEDEAGENTQSPNDNEAGYAEMYPSLSQSFEEKKFVWRYGLFHELVGGLRFDEEKNTDVAAFLKVVDKVLVEHDVIPATEFLFVGRKEA